LICSDYEKQCFKSAFNLKNDVEYVCSFPPRLDKVKYDGGASTRKIILYCPTWRDDGSFLFQNVVDVERLNNLMREMNLTFVIKPHPSDKIEHLSADYTNVILESSKVDIYGLLSKSVLLVTDYSSMLFDATYCEIPTVLFCPDLEQYQRENRGFYTPIQDLGLPVVVTEDDLLEKIQNVNNINTSYFGNKYFDVYENRDISI
jgi:CDP-glycerol glycerophosphotransferase (TagB/SpsB family)